MKKFLSVLLTIVMFSSLITPVAFAEDVVKNETLSIGDKFSGMTTVTKKGMYGKSEDDELCMAPSYTGTTAKATALNLQETINTSSGDKIRISFSLARDAEGSKCLGVGLAGACGDTELKSTVGTAKLDFSTGVVVADQANNVAAPEATKVVNVATPHENWTTYDIVYTVGSDGDAAIPNTYSIYVNGICSVNEAVFENRAGEDFPAITSVSGIAFLARKNYTWNLYFDDIRLAHYPASIADRCVITADPMADSDGDTYADIDTNKYFKINTDGSLMVNDLSVTSAAIAELAPEGWTFKYVNTDGTDVIADTGYLVMKNEDGTTYYKKIISPIYTSLLDVTHPATAETNKYNIDYRGVRWLSNTGGTKTFVINNIEGKSASDADAAVSLSYIKPAGGQINGFRATAQGTLQNDKSSMVETGRIAYEVSVLIPEAPTRKLAIEVCYNGTIASGATTVSGATRTPFAINENGTLTIDDSEDLGWYIEPAFEGFKFNWGEWYRLTCVMNTENNTGEFYINGEKAIVLKNKEINTLNFIQVGFITRGASNTDNDAFTFIFDDISIKKLRSDWTVPTLELTSKNNDVTIDNKNGLILGEFADIQAFSDAVAIPEGATYDFYTERTITSAAEEGTVGKYLLVKNADETIIREYVIASHDLTVTGLDVSDIKTDETGSKSITVSIENMTAADIDTMVAIASYSSDGTLVALDTLTKPAVFKTVTDYTVALDVKEDEPISEIKAFVWKSSGITPLKQNVSTKK